MYTCQHFKIQELVPPHVFEARGEKAWELLDVRALITLDAIRSRYGATIVNDYDNGGARKWSGLRTGESPYFSPYSQHTFGRAFDCIFLEAEVQDVREDVIKNREKWFPYITGLELNVSWLHFDVRNHRPIKLF